MSWFDLQVAVPPTLFEMVTEQLQPLQLKVTELVVEKQEDTVVAVALRKQLKAIQNDVEGKRVDATKPMNEMVKAINAKAKEIEQPILELLKTIDDKVINRQKAEEERIAEIRRQEQAKLDAERKAREEEERKVREAQEAKRREEEAKLAEQQRIADEKLRQAQLIENEAERKKAEEEAKIAEERAALEREKQEREEKKRKEAEAIRESEKKAQREKEQLELAEKTKAEKALGTKKRWTFKIENQADIPRDYLTVDEKMIREAIKNGIRIIPGVKIYEETWF